MTRRNSRSDRGLDIPATSTGNINNINNDDINVPDDNNLNHIDRHEIYDTNHDLIANDESLNQIHNGDATGNPVEVQHVFRTSTHPEPRKFI